MSPPEVRRELFKSIGNEKRLKETGEAFVFQAKAFGETPTDQGSSRKPGKPVQGMRLNGVVFSSNQQESVAFVSIPNSQLSKSVRVGQLVNGYKCEKIEEDRIVLSYKGNEIILKLFETKGIKVLSSKSTNMSDEKKEIPFEKPKVQAQSKSTFVVISREDVRAFRKSIKSLSPEEKKKAFKKKAEEPGWKDAFERMKERGKAAGSSSGP